MAALLAAQAAAVLHHVFVDILIPHLGFGVADAQFVKSFVEAEVTHDRCDHSVAQKLSPLLHILAVDVENMVSGNDITLFIYAQASVSVAVIGKTHVQLIVNDIPLKHLDMGGARVGIDIVAIGVSVNEVGFGPQGVKYGFGNIPGGTVGAVQAHLHALEGIHPQGDQVAHISVPACHMVHSPADHVPFRQGQLLPAPAEGFQVAVQVGFHQGDDAFVHFFAVAIDQLNAVVIVGIMAGGNHNAAVKTLRPDNIGHRRRGGNVQQVGVRAGGYQAAHQAVLKHIATAPGVLADDDPGRLVGTAAAGKLGIIPAQETTHLKGMIRR